MTFTALHPAPSWDDQYVQQPPEQGEMSCRATVVDDKPLHMAAAALTFSTMAGGASPQPAHLTQIWFLGTGAARRRWDRRLIVLP